MSLKFMRFPSGDSLRQGFWQPVFFSHNFDTPERLVAAVIAFVDGEWHVSRAAALERLRCLYGAESALARDAIVAALDALEASLDGFSGDNLKFESWVSGVTLGERVVAQSVNARDLSIRRLRAISSLHSRQLEKDIAEDSEQATVPARTALERDISRDRLPVLVMESMVERAPQTRSAFSAHVLKLQEDESARRLTHKAYVAYTGQNIVANFATLKAGRQKVSVDVSKRLMWDLEQHRDADHSLLNPRSHEMLLYHLPKDDPTITPRQYDNIMEVIDTLNEEGKNREIKVLSYESVPVIANHLLAVEGYAT